jgi:uncharacterized protein (TIGR02145 family)
MKTIIRILVTLLIIVLCSHCEREKLPRAYTGKVMVFSEAAYCYGWVYGNDETDPDEYGFVWSTIDGSDIQNSKPAYHNGTNYFETIISGLSPDKAYSLKAYAILGESTVYGEGKEITTKRNGTLTDNRDGRTYKWVEIGDQIWMAENLSYLPYISPFTNDTGIFVYNYKGSSVDIAKNTEEFKKYGCLYTWEISLHVCPDGWHLPGDAEWQELERSVGMTLRQIGGYGWQGNNEDNLLKSTSWSEYNGKPNNATSFSALPAGYHHLEDTYYGYIYFSGLGNLTYFGSSTKYDFPIMIGLASSSKGIMRTGASENYGCSIRCIRD